MPTRYPISFILKYVSSERQLLQKGKQINIFYEINEICKMSLWCDVFELLFSHHINN